MQLTAQKTGIQLFFSLLFMKNHAVVSMKEYTLFHSM